MWIFVCHQDHFTRRSAKTVERFKIFVIVFSSVSFLCYGYISMNVFADEVHRKIIKKIQRHFQPKNKMFNFFSRDSEQIIRVTLVWRGFLAKCFEHISETPIQDSKLFAIMVSVPDFGSWQCKKRSVIISTSLKSSKPRFQYEDSFGSDSRCPCYEWHMPIFLWLKIWLHYKTLFPGQYFDPKNIYQPYYLRKIFQWFYIR